MALYRDISTGITQEFDFDPTGRNVYSKFQPVDATGKALNSPSIMEEARKRLENAPQNAPLPIPAANNTPPLGGAGSVNISHNGPNKQPTPNVTLPPPAPTMDLGSILSMFAGANQPQQPATQPTAMTPSPLQGGSSFRMSDPGTGQSGIWMNIPPGIAGGSNQTWAIAGAGPYRQKIQQQLLSRGYTPQEVETILADFDATPQGQLELGPQAPAMATGASQDLNNMLMGLLTGTQTAGASDASMWSAFGDLFSGAPASQAGDAPGGGFGDLFQGTFEASGLGGTGTGADGGFQSFADFLGGLDTGVGTGFGGLDLSEAGIEKMANDWAESQNYSSGAYAQVAKMFGQFMANETDANAADIDIAGMMAAEGDVDAVLEALNLPSFDTLSKQLKDDPDALAIALESLGQTKLGVLTGLVGEAQSKRQFVEAVRQFDENLAIAKQNQRVSIFESMSNLTMERLKLNETSKTNLMSAQLSAMDTALKSKELSQAEAADIRQNMLDSVALELEAGRINQEQEQFLMQHFLNTEELALRVRQLEEQGRSADADRELELRGMVLADNLGYAELAFGREQLGQERELGFASLAQRQQEANLNAQIALLTAAMQNPSAFAALRSMGGLTGGGAPAAAGTPAQMFPDLGNLGFQIPETAGGGATTPTPAFFTGGMPTIGALGQLDPSSLAFLQNVLGFGGTTPEALGSQAAAVTPAAGGFAGLGRTLFG